MEYVSTKQNIPFQDPFSSLSITAPTTIAMCRISSILRVCCSSDETKERDELTLRAQVEGAMVSELWLQGGWTDPCGGGRSAALSR